MDIVVLVKQVPATESMIEIAGDGQSIKTDNVKWVVNPYDEFAIEEAVRIKEKQGGTVTLVTAGPDKAKEAMRTGLAMGADKGILINDPAIANIDALSLAKVLAETIKTLTCDLIITGQRAVDDDNYIIGPAVAEYLGIPSVSLVTRVELADKRVRFERTIEGGSLVVETRLPALFTTQRGLNEPRYTSLPGIMKAKKKPIEVKTVADLGLESGFTGESKTTVVSMRHPEKRTGGKMVQGETAAEKAKELVRLLHEEAGVL